jgi:hypothetical protein
MKVGGIPISWPFGLSYDHLVFLPFGIFYDHSVYFPPFWYFVPRKNLATLLARNRIFLSPNIRRCQEKKLELILILLDGVVQFTLWLAIVTRKTIAKN